MYNVVFQFLLNSFRFSRLSFPIAKKNLKLEENMNFMVQFSLEYWKSACLLKGGRDRNIQIRRRTNYELKNEELWKLTKRKVKRETIGIQASIYSRICTNRGILAGELD